MSKERNIFEMATREKYRFPYKGMITVEDMWDLSLQSLDSVFKTLNAQVKRNQEESLLKTKTDEDIELDTKIAIIRYIVGVKQQEAADRLQAKEKKEKKQKLLDALNEKRDQKIKDMTEEELEKALAELEQQY